MRDEHRVRSVDLSHVAFTLGDSPLCHERGIRRTESVVACGDERPAWNGFQVAAAEVSMKACMVNGRWVATIRRSVAGGTSAAKMSLNASALM
jgi:hypothetical protein